MCVCEECEEVCVCEEGVGESMVRMQAQASLVPRPTPFFSVLRFPLTIIHASICIIVNGN